MKKFLYNALAVLAAFVVPAVPYSGAYASEEEYIETGVIDMTGESFVMGGTGSLSPDMPDFPEILAASDSGSYLLGDYLDANNKLVYDEFVKLVNPSLNDITIELPEPVQFTSSSKELSGSDPDLYNAVFSPCSSGMHAALFDMPEIFWVCQNDISVSPEKISYKYSSKTKLYTYTIKTITITPACYSAFTDVDEIREYKQKLEKAVEDFSVTGESTAEKLRSIHNKIAEFTDYDMSADFSGSALSSLVTGGSVCEGYAKGFKMICDRLEIPCVCVFGNYNSSSSTAHMWNYVLMEDGYWYAVDVTWDDKDGKDGIEFSDTYFLKGSADFNTNHTPCEEYFTTKLKYPELAEWNYTSTVYEYGDINHDGKVSVADLVCCASYVLGAENIEYSCDVNNDGRADVFDVVIMRQLVADTLKDLA